MEYVSQVSSEGYKIVRNIVTFVIDNIFEYEYKSERSSQRNSWLDISAEDRHQGDNVRWWSMERVNEKLQEFLHQLSNLFKALGRCLSKMNKLHTIDFYLTVFVALKINYFWVIPVDKMCSNSMLFDLFLNMKYSHYRWLSRILTVI